MLQICSFNCHSLKNSLSEVSSVSDKNDLVFLQETWLAKFELPMLNTIHPDFLGLGTTAFDSSASLLCGRPYGGVAILWRKSLQPLIKVSILSERIMQIDVMTKKGTVSLLNVYLPTDYRDSESHDQFCMCLGQLACELDLISTKTSYFGIIGDFNANSHGSVFFSELADFCSDNGLLISDVLFLGSSSDTYTFVSAAHGSSSWLDHCISSPSLHSSIQNIKIHYDISMHDHMPVSINLAVQPAAAASFDTAATMPAKPNWRGASAENIAAYNHFIHDQLQPLQYSVLGGLESECRVDCDHDEHLDKVLDCYNVLTASIAQGGRHCIEPKCVGKPRHPKSIPQWNQCVKLKHELARKAFLLWRSHGSPKGGPIALLMRQTRLSFKYALRKCRREQKKVMANKMASALLGQEPTRFWTLIRQQLGTGTPLPPSFGEVSGSENITKMWADHFCNIFSDLTCSSDTSILLQLSNDKSTRTPPIDARDVSAAVAKLKSGKSPGWDNISTDHMLHLHPDIFAIIATLFNCMINHSKLPEGLLYSQVVPLIKDKSGALDDKSNYRAISLSTTLSKVLELILIERLQPFLFTNDAQFGFKPSHSTTHAAYSFKETVNYYTTRGSPVYVCFLDASKAFDRVCHSKLFKILSDRGVPSSYLKLLMSWYRTQKMGVRWSGSESDPFHVQNGVRQGGNLSPLLFNVYIDDLLCQLQKLNVGCHVGNCAVNVIAYADDIVLLSPTRKGLQELVQKCETFALSRDIQFNVKKTVCMLFNPREPYAASHLSGSKSPDVFLNGQRLVWVENFKYLGHVLSSSFSDGPDMRRAKRLLYYGVNMICARVGFADRDVLVRLFRAYCTNLYGCELWNTLGEKKAFRELCVAYHSCIKKLVRVPRWTRNHDLCKELGLLPGPMLVASRQLSFYQRLLSSENNIVRNILTSEIGNSGIYAKLHVNIRQEYGLMAMDLTLVQRSDIRNVFTANLDRFVNDRLLQGNGHSPGQYLVARQ